MMYRYRTFVIFVVVLMLLVSCTPATPAKMGSEKVLLIAQDNSGDMELMLTKEVGVMIDMLEKAGFDVIVASPAGQPIKGTSTTLTPDMKFSDVNLDDYVGVIIPCMFSDLGDPKPKAEIEIIKKAAAQGKPLAAQDGGVYLLALAGVLKGKQYAISDSYTDLIYSGTYKGSGVVQDGNIVTSGNCPFVAKWDNTSDGTAKLTQKFIDTLILRQ